MEKTENKLIFQPLYFADKIRVINPAGKIGVVTLWSHPDWVIGQLKEAGVDLCRETSKIAVVGTLYGNGLPELLRNLVYNPQLTMLIVAGKDRSGSAEELINFFEQGLEEVEFLGQKLHRIKGTSRMIDGGVHLDMFTRAPRIIYGGELKSDEDLQRISHILNSEIPPSCAECRRSEIPLVSPETVTFPSNPRNHNITGDDALECWKELIFRLIRFGHRTHIRKGDRLELQNVRVVVEKPAFVDFDNLKKFGFIPGQLMDYYENFIDPVLPPDTTYTYGNRIGAYFGVNTLDEVVNRLKKDPEDRASYVSLWDTSKDISSEEGHPCLVSLYFRRYQGGLTLTATFRTHNSLDAWMKNFYGLMRVQNEVCSRLEVKPGAITIISQSISVDPKRLDIAKSIAESKSFTVNLDPNGNFSIDIEDGEIVLRHFFQGVQIGEYKGKKSVRLQHELYRNCALSDINHALYLGRMMERAERCLKNNEEFIQE
jgi:thymidylate synthase